MVTVVVTVGVDEVVGAALPSAVNICVSVVAAEDAAAESAVEGDDPSLTWRLCFARLAARGAAARSGRAARAETAGNERVNRLHSRKMNDLAMTAGCETSEGGVQRKKDSLVLCDKPFVYRIHVYLLFL